MTTSHRIDGGLRARGQFNKKSEPGRPLISVITVVRNGEKTLEQTILSVLDQTYDNIEYIVVDGGSTDGTLNTVRKYEDKVAYWLSELDKGIYDAMNKGINLSMGDWITFMNTGDIFYKHDTVEKVMRDMPANAELIYGHSIKDFGSFTRLQLSGELKDLWKSTVFWHQCLFTKTGLMKTNLFNARDTLTADYEFTVKMVKEKRSFYRSNVVIAIVSAGGISDINRIKTIMSRWKIARKYYGKLHIDLYYSLLILEASLKSLIKKILPAGIVASLLKNKKSSV